MKKCVREFLSNVWSRSGCHRMLNQLLEEGSADINYTLTHNAALWVMHINWHHKSSLLILTASLTH